MKRRALSTSRPGRGSAHRIGNHDDLPGGRRGRQLQSDGRSWSTDEPEPVSGDGCDHPLLQGHANKPAQRGPVPDQRPTREQAQLLVLEGHLLEQHRNGDRSSHRTVSRWRSWSRRAALLLTFEEHTLVRENDKHRSHSGSCSERSIAYVI